MTAAAILMGCSATQNPEPATSQAPTAEERFLHYVRVEANPGDAPDDSPFFDLSDSTLIAAGQRVCDTVPEASSILEILRKSDLRGMGSIDDRSGIVVAAIVSLCPEHIDTFEATTGVDLPESI